MTFSVLTPRSVSISAVRLRDSSAAPTSSTIDAAISATTSTDAHERTCLMTVPRLPARMREDGIGPGGDDRGAKARDDRRGSGDANREDQDRQVDLDRIEPRQLRRLQVLQEADEAKGDRDAGDAADGGDDAAFGEHVGDESPAWRAERHPHRDFPGPNDWRARIRFATLLHATSRTSPTAPSRIQSAGPIGAADVVDERRHLRAQVDAAVGKLRLQYLIRARGIGARRIERHAVLQARNELPSSAVRSRTRPSPVERANPSGRHTSVLARGYWNSGGITPTIV